jgi:hypothetical protein
MITCTNEEDGDIDQPGESIGDESGKEKNEE